MKREIVDIHAIEFIEQRARRVRDQRKPGWHEELIALMNQWEDAKRAFNARRERLQPARGLIHHTWTDVIGKDNL